MALTGRIFDISRGCVDDGPGLRTVVFLKGCPLDCPWCQNIEGKSFAPEIAWDAKKCIGCKQCVKVCTRKWSFKVPNAWREGCTACGACVVTCPSKARQLVGKLHTVEDLVAEVSADAQFFAGTQGGVTFSGGEPLAQHAFLFACAKELRKRGIHVAVETAGYWPESLRDDLLHTVDIVLFDLKHVDGPKFRGTIGKKNTLILDNLKAILATDIPVEIRIPLIPGFNADPADEAALVAWLKKASRTPPVRLLPLHRLAIGKQALFGKKYPFADVPLLTDAQAETAREIFTQAGIPLIKTFNSVASGTERKCLY